MLEELKKRVYDANMALPKHGLVTFTWGNASEIDRETGLFAIKPSGVSYDDLKPEDMVIMDLDGNVVEGKYRPSTDMETHRKLYLAYPEIGGVVHTHSTNATGWAQTGLCVPCFGTTHADYFYGPVPCTRDLTEAEISEGYEWNTGNVIVETIGDGDPMAVPGILCAHHGPFSWGKNAADAVYHAVVLEEVCKMAIVTLSVKPDSMPAPQYLQDKHYLRKHGKNAYYGQN